jgi:hypothetical protein
MASIGAHDSFVKAFDVAIKADKSFTKPKALTVVTEQIRSRLPQTGNGSVLGYERNDSWSEVSIGGGRFGHEGERNITNIVVFEEG